MSSLPFRYPRRALLLGLLALIIVGLGACDRLTKLTAEDHLRRAHDFYKQGRAPEAFIEVKNVLQQQPNDVTARLLLARMHLATGNVAAAEQETQRALKADPRHLEARLGLDEIRLLQHKYDDVLRSLEVSPAGHEARVAHMRGDAWYGKGDRARGCLSFQQAKQTDSRYVPAYWGLAKCAAADKKFDAARLHLDQALKIEPSNDRSWTLLADVERASGRLPAAEKAYDNALALNPRSIEALGGRAAIRISTARLKGAQQDIAALSQINSRLPAVGLLQGMLHFQRRDYAKAKTNFDNLLKASPGYSSGIFWAGLTNYALQNYELASKLFYRYLQDYPDAQDVRAMQAVIQAQLGNSGAAKALLKNAEPETVPDVGSLTLMGLAHMQLGDSQSGTRFLREAVKRKPDSSNSRGDLARALVEQGNIDGALAEVDAAIALNPKDVRSRVMKIRILTHSGRPTEALSAIDGLKMLVPPELVANERGMFFVLRKDDANAQKEFSEALRLKPGFEPAAYNLTQLELRKNNIQGAKRTAREAYLVNPDSFTLLQTLYDLEKKTGASAAATELVRKAVKRNPAAAGPLALQAREFLAANDPARALSSTHQAAAAHPDDVALLEVRGAAFAASGDAHNALSTLGRLVSLRPNSTEALFLLAQAQVASGRISDARRSLERINELQPNQLRIEAALARLAIQENNTAQALAAAQKISEKYPHAQDGTLIEAEAYLLAKRTAEAVAVLSKAAQKFPDSAPIAEALAHTHWITGAPDKTLAVANTWLKKQPQDNRMSKLAAEAYVALGKKAEARELYEQIIKRDSRDPRVLNNLAWVLQDSEPSRAFALAEQAYKLAPNDPDVGDTLGWLALSQGKLLRAQEILKQVVKQAPGKLTYQYHYAVALHRGGKSEAAARVLGDIVTQPFAEREQALTLLAQIRS